MLTDQERLTAEEIEERSPEAIKPRILELTKIHAESGAELTVLNTETKIIKEMMKGLQSTLKSVSQF